MTGLRPGVIRAIVVAVALLALFVTLFIDGFAALGCIGDATGNICTASDTQQAVTLGGPLAVLALGAAWSIRQARLTPVLFACPLTWVAMVVVLGAVA